MAASIRADNIVPRTGVRIATFTIRNADLVDGVQISSQTLADIDDWFMVLSVAKDVGKFLSFSTPPGTECKTGADARRYVGSALKVPAAVLQAREFAVIKMSKAANFNFQCEVDTDSPVLIGAAQRLQAGAGRSGTPAGMPVPLTFDVFAIEPSSKKVLSSRVEATLTLAPLRPMERFDGYVALDFGNTSTTLVRTGTHEDSFEVIQADLRHPRDTADKQSDRPTPARTALRIKAFKPAEKAEQFTQYLTRIGEQALTEDGPGRWLALGAGSMATRSLPAEPADWLVLGAKRLLSDRRRSEAGSGTVIVLQNQVHTIPAEDPAELFIANMLAGFFHHEQSIPSPIVVTCPTTFNESEVARLRRTVARALHRVQGEAASSFRQSMIDSRVPLVVDEASAAAFYFAYQDFMCGPGRMPAFRYLYPDGMNLLLYDCGGGTTDLSLIRLEAPDVNYLKLSVLGRAGHRTFGGDFITEQVFRLLKMKIARLKGEFPDPPPPAKLAGFLREHEKEIDKCVPTKYDARQMQNDDAQERRTATLALWSLAEAMKVRLATANTVTPDNDMASLLNPVGENFALGATFTDWAATLDVSRRELDSLIDPDIDRTIDFANDLIRTCMAAQAEARITAAPAPLEVPEVHWVYLVGNAARYPRIKERMLDPEQGLNVRYLKERLAEVPSEDFKNSVAKGAVVAMRFQRQAMGATVSWDEDLIRKLPFDIVHTTLGGTGDHIFFHAGDLYSKRLRKTINVRPSPGSGRAVTQEIVLSRKWPGEVKAEKYLVFRFPEPIKGVYVIEYDDEDEHAFIAYPDREGGRDERVIADPVESAPYIAPPQSGKI
jgi:hypothetical protein